MSEIAGNESRGLINRILGVVEFAGNKLPDPAVLFLLLLFVTWGVSYFLAPIEFTEVSPKTGEPIPQELLDRVRAWIGLPPLQPDLSWLDDLLFDEREIPVSLYAFDHAG